MAKMTLADKIRLHNIEKTAQKVDALSEKYKNMSDEELRGKTAEFRQKIASGASLDSIKIEAFATAREACRRVRGEYPYHVQVMAGDAIHRGDIAEQATGEGKTLTSVLPAYLNALDGKGVHVVTVNEYLARRDWEAMGKVHAFLGLTVGLNLAGMSPTEKRAAYASDITYTTNSELGFDYLRDNMVKKPEDRVQRGLHYAIVDEVDSILIDDARTPLIISGSRAQKPGAYAEADQFAKSLSGNDYEIHVREKAVTLTESGIEKCGKFYHLDNVYTPENAETLHYVFNAMRANYIMKRDTDYVVSDGEVLIVDPNTGRVMKGREWSEGLHQAVCAKERVEIKDETITTATITYQNFFRMYDKLSGMTGTAKTSEEEFIKVYNMLVYSIPNNKPCIRKDLPDLIFGTKKAKYAAIVNEVESKWKEGQPVLLGTVAVETSELLSGMLSRKGIPHEVLNAKNHEREAEIISKAGQKGAVTIATNMAGRGTDIKLGEGVAKMGGLYIIGSERHESKRIDNQLRGRAGRQGDPGVSRFYVSMQDDLIKRFGAERLEASFAELGDESVESKLFSRAIEDAQMRVEGVNFDSRQNMLKYDDVMRKQREAIYKIRNTILDDEKETHRIIQDMMNRAASAAAHAIFNKNTNSNFYFNPEIYIDGNEKTEREMQKHIAERVWQDYEEKTFDFQLARPKFERQVALAIIDQFWIEHIDYMAKLKNGIGLRSYAQSNPLQAYIQEGFEKYDEMLTNIACSITNVFVNMKINVEKQ